MTVSGKARVVGVNHVALEVGDIEAALAFYGQFLEFSLRGKSETMAFVDMGDQFLALSKVDSQPVDNERHFGLVVDDKEKVRLLLEKLGIERVSERFLDYRDPWGNRFEIVGYDNIQFTKADHVLGGMGLADLEKNDNAIKELTDKGMAPA